MWLIFIYSRPRYDTPCGAILGPSANHFRWEIESSCGVTHWLTTGIAVSCVVFAGSIVADRRSEAATRVVLALPTAPARSEE